MFKRRHPLTLPSRVRRILWPAGGWHRTTLYIAHRLGRLPGTPYRIACGFACGAAVSFTPFIGFHFVLAMGLSLLLRGNLIASAIGTVVGNPWSFPLIWAWTYALGRWILGHSGFEMPAGELTLSHIFDNPMQVLLPMTIGGLPTAVAAWFISYWPVRGLVEQYQRTRRWRLRRKARLRRAVGAKQATQLERHAEAGE